MQTALLAVLLVSVSLCQADEIYQGCFCFYEWNDANRVGNWTFEENWLQLEEPPLVAFVSISGDNTITTDKRRIINELVVGPNRWDTTRLVIDEDLFVSAYRHHPSSLLSFSLSRRPRRVPHPLPSH